MEDQNKKWVNLICLFSSALVGYLFSSILGKVVVFCDLEAKIQSIHLICKCVSIFLFLFLFLFFYRYHPVSRFINEVVIEFSKVTWPGQKETVSATFIVIVMVLVSGVVFGFLDYIWASLLKWIL